jgi:hypothetical protein
MDGCAQAQKRGGSEAVTIDEDEMKLQILQAANRKMEDSRMFMLPDHCSKPTGFDM